MNYRVSITVGTVCLLAAISMAVAGDVVPGQVIVRANTTTLDLSNAPITGLVKADSIMSANIYLFTYPANLSSATVTDTLLKLEGVQKVEPNRKIALPKLKQIGTIKPDVENQAVFLRGSDPDEFYDQDAVDKIKLDSAHATATGEGTVVAIIDNGIDLTHPLFDSTLTDTMYDYIDDDTTPAEDTGSACGHGTFIAGLVLLAAPDCKIMPIRAFDGDGDGTYFDVAKSIYLAIQEEVDVINMSFGSSDTSSTLLDACQDAFESGIALVAAAGNDSSDTVLYPAGYPWVTAVSAIDETDSVASFSNYGGHIDVCAPGVNLYSAIPGDTIWGIWSGTSFATALVSGGCALMRDDDSTLTTDPIRYRIRSEAETELDWGTVYPHDNYYGYGCLDADAAVDYVADPGEYICGDVNADGAVNSDDTDALQRYVNYGSPAPDPLDSGDVNGSGRIDIDDVVYLGAYVAGTGDEPACSD